MRWIVKLAILLSLKKNNTCYRVMAGAFLWTDSLLKRKSLSEIVAVAKVKSATMLQVKFDADASSEIKSTHSPARRISHCEAIFHPPVRADLAEKAHCISSQLFADCYEPFRCQLKVGLLQSQKAVKVHFVFHGVWVLTLTLVCSFEDTYIG